AADVAVVAAIQVVGSFGAARGQPEREPLDALAIMLLLAGPALLFFRRRYPVAVLASVLSVSLVYLVLGYPYGPVILSDIIGIYTAVTSGHRVAAWTGTGLLYAVHMAYRWAFEARPGALEMLAVGAWLLLIVAASEVGRAYQERTAARA